MNSTKKITKIDEIDRLIIKATQGGLPLCANPYDLIANNIGIDALELENRMKNMLDVGIIRRIGLVPNHYALGYTANGMSVWDVPDDQIDILGKRIGALDFVSHCYNRPRHMPDWPYNLFAMTHGQNRDEVEGKVKNIAKELGGAVRDVQILYSIKILKKTGFRLKNI